MTDVMSDDFHNHIICLTSEIGDLKKLVADTNGSISALSVEGDRFRAEIMRITLRNEERILELEKWHWKYSGGIAITAAILSWAMLNLERLFGFH